MPAATMRPRPITTIASATCWTSWSRWLDSSTRAAAFGEAAQHPAHPADARGVEAVDPVRRAPAPTGRRGARARCRDAGACRGSTCRSGGEPRAPRARRWPASRRRAWWAGPSCAPASVRISRTGASGVLGRRVEQAPDLAAGVGVLGEPAPADGRRAVIRARQPGEDAQRGRLAGAVGPQEAGDLSGPGLEAHPVDGDERTEALGELLHDDHEHSVAFPRGRRRSPLAPNVGRLRTAGVRRRPTFEGGRARRGSSRGGRGPQAGSGVPYASRTGITPDQCGSCWSSSSSRRAAGARLSRSTR